MHHGRQNRYPDRRYPEDDEDPRDVEIARLQQEVDRLRFDRRNRDEDPYAAPDTPDQWGRNPFADQTHYQPQHHDDLHPFADAPRGFRRYHHDDPFGKIQQLFNLEYVPEPFVDEYSLPIYDTDAEKEEDTDAIYDTDGGDSVNEYDVLIYDTDGEEDETDSRSSLPEEREESKGLHKPVISKLPDVYDTVINDVDDIDVNCVSGVKVEVVDEVVGHKPDVVVLEVATLNCRQFKEDIFEVMLKLAVDGLNIIYVDETLPRLYENSETTFEQFQPQSGIINCATALGCYLQNPLAKAASIQRSFMISGSIYRKEDLLNHSLDKKEYVYSEPFDIIDSRTSLFEEGGNDAGASSVLQPDQEGRFGQVYRRRVGGRLLDPG